MSDLLDRLHGRQHVADAPGEVEIMHTKGKIAG